MALITESDPAGRAERSTIHIELEIGDTVYTEESLRMRLEAIQSDFRQRLFNIGQRLCSLARIKGQQRNNMRVQFLVDNPLSLKVPEKEMPTLELDVEIKDLFVERIIIRGEIKKVHPCLIAINSRSINLNVSE